MVDADRLGAEHGRCDHAFDMRDAGRTGRIGSHNLYGYMAYGSQINLTCWQWGKERWVDSDDSSGGNG